MPQFTIDATGRTFQRDLKEARKRHPSIVDDVAATLRGLADNSISGDWIPGLGKGVEVRKIRLGVKKENIGKSGGYRLIYLVEAETKVIRLLFLHFKPREALVPLSEIEAAIKMLSNQGESEGQNEASKPS